MIKTAIVTKLAGYGFQVSLAIIAGLFIIIGAQQWRLHTAKTEIAQVSEQLATEKAQTALVAQEAERAARRLEREHRDAMDRVRDTLIGEREHVEAQRDELLDRVAAGGLRQRFTCPPGGGVPGASPTTPGGDGAGQGGFTAEDAAIAIGIAADGDRAIRQLAACQDALRVGR